MLPFSWRIRVYSYSFRQSLECCLQGEEMAVVVLSNE